ncbi:MAG: DUF4080 domain-containing protein [Prevotellaceae bacterium]|jgi:hypothetical protein|nr:DUF4080 domain-containing protein [Prevotellaceae bacterium]
MILFWLDINSSFAHSSLALPALHAQSTASEREWQWHVVSGTIHTPIHHFINEVTKLQPDLIVATSWLFTHNRLIEVLSRSKALSPHAYILLGGPQFLGNNETFLRAHPYVNAVFRGEGEEIFPKWLRQWAFPEIRDRLTGICTIDKQGIYCDHGRAQVSHFQSLLPPESSKFFPTDKPFVQIETTRGCFNDCYFCVSGGDRPIRTLSIEQLRDRLLSLSHTNVKEIRILDRTFNADPRRTKEMFQLFCEFAGIFRFHIEIHPALLTSEFTYLLSLLPKQLLHIEAGLQSLDDHVLKSSGRAGNSQRSIQGIKLLTDCHCGEIHTDLISGLPNYTLSRVKEDVIELIRLRVDEVQLEQLKVLPGTKMRDLAPSMGIIYSSTPPYEVLATPSMSPEELYEAQQLSRLLDGWYNNKSEWREPFVQLTLGEPCFLDTFLHHLMHEQRLEQPLSRERRGLLLYDFCLSHHPSYISHLSAAWIKAGYSLKKAPGLHAVPYNCPTNRDTTIRYFHLPSSSGGYWFGFDRNQERRKPVTVLQFPPEHL